MTTGSIVQVMPPTVPDTSWLLAWAPFVLGLLIVMVAGVLLGRRFVAAVGTATPVIILAVLFCHGLGILPFQARYDWQHHVIFISIDLPNNNPMPGSPPSAPQAPAPQG